jgi:hypothetical protein
MRNVSGRIKFFRKNAGASPVRHRNCANGLRLATVEDPCGHDVGGEGHLFGHLHAEATVTFRRVHRLVSSPDGACI